MKVYSAIISQNSNECNGSNQYKYDQWRILISTWMRLRFYSIEVLVLAKLGPNIEIYMYLLRIVIQE